MTALISFPFRLAPTGYVVTRDDHSVEYYAEELGCLIGTMPGERPLVPLYGITDPTFHRVDPNEIAIKTGIFGPPVLIKNVVPKWVSDTQQDVTVEFEPMA